MAIYRLHANVVSRSQGRNIVSASAYRAGEKIHDERTGVTYDFTGKKDVVFKEIFLPDNSPEWMSDRAKLWNLVELNEKRKDAQLAREVQLTLPRELSIEQNSELVREFVKNEFVAQGMVADVCLHNPKGTDGLNQPHAHILLSLREVSEEGFGLKKREWNSKPLLEHWREEWGNTVNKHLALHGIDMQVSHRSYKDQGILLEPQYKIGPAVAKDRMARLADHQRIARENGFLLLERPDIALDALTRQQSTFTYQDLARFINRHTENPEQFQQVYEKVKASSLMISLGLDDKNKERFTTQEMLDIESGMIDSAKALFEHNAHFVNQSSLSKTAQSFQLSAEQTRAFEYLVSPGDLKNVVGYAGTGKSRLLGAACVAWEQEGYRVSGATLSGIAAENLEASSGIESRTIASRMHAWQQGRELLTSKDILVIDEAGMLGTRQLALVVKEAHLRGAKLALTGDPQEQLQAIEAGAPFRGIIDATDSKIELKEIWRQSVPWQKEASVLLSTRQTAQALSLYEAHDCVHEFATKSDAKRSLIDVWNDIRITQPEKTQIMLTFKRDDVFELNEMARSRRLSLGELMGDTLVKTARGERKMAAGEIIYFLKNDRDLGVKNGTLGTILSVKDDKLTVQLNKGDKDKAPVICFSTHRYQDLDYGYASTVHKGQGGTFDRALVLASRYLDRHSTNVALTRHREGVQVFWSRDEFPHHGALIHCLSRDATKDLASDYLKPEQAKADFASNRGLYGVWETFWEKHGSKWVEKIQSFLGKETITLNVTDESNIDERRARLDKLEAFTKATLAQRNPGSLSLQESLLRPDLNDFKQQFEKNNPDLAKALRQKIAEVPEHDPLVKNEAAVKQTEEAAIKHSACARELELER